MTQESDPTPTDLIGSNFHINPYETYARLREFAPVYWSEKAESWLVSRYEDVAAGFRDSRLSSARIDIFSDRLSGAVSSSVRPLLQCLASFLGMSDPPDHTRLRRAAGHALNREVVSRLRSGIQVTVDRLLDEVGTTMPVDMIESIGYPLPALTITRALGLPDDDTVLFRGWTENIVAFISSTTVDDERAARSAESLEALTDYLEPILAMKRQAPQDDLISNFVAAEAQGLISRNELMATCVTTLAGGRKTTTNLIGNATLALLTHPEQLVRLRADPSLMKSAVEEFLRFDSPVPRAWRFARETLRIANVDIPANDPVLLLAASANHDATQFENPESLDIGRSPNPHIGFGVGAHHCIGAPLARLETEVLFDRLLSRFTNIQLAFADPLPWKEDLALAHRGLESLWVNLN